MAGTTMLGRALACVLAVFVCVPVMARESGSSGSGFGYSGSTMLWSKESLAERNDGESAGTCFVALFVPDACGAAVPGAVYSPVTSYFSEMQTECGSTVATWPHAGMGDVSGPSNSVATPQI